MLEGFCDVPICSSSDCLALNGVRAWQSSGWKMPNGAAGIYPILGRPGLLACDLCPAQSFSEFDAQAQRRINVLGLHKACEPHHCVRLWGPICSIKRKFIYFEGAMPWSSIRSSRQFAAATALAVTLGIVGTPAQARLTADGSTKGVAVTAITPMRDVARGPASDTRLPRLAI